MPTDSPKAEEFFSYRKIVLSYLDIKNAIARTEWTRKFFGGYLCSDTRTEAERATFESWYAAGMSRAMTFLWASNAH